MFNKSRTEKQLLYSEVERLKKMNGKLADENRRLREGLVDIERYRKKYKELVSAIEMIKSGYRDKLCLFDDITPLYNFLKNKITHKTLSHV